jgi:hypothetical protein
MTAVNLGLKQPSPSSTIRVLHASYEAAYAAYNALDAANQDLGSTTPDRKRSYGIEVAMTSAVAEADALRIAILRQVPGDMVDAEILLFHIHTAVEMGSEGEQSRALATAVSTVFDFMCCEVDQDHEQLGQQFQSATLQVFEARRLRTGVLED